MLSNFTNKPSASGSANGQSPVGLGARPASSARPDERGAPSVIGPDLTIIGNLISRGEVQVHGEVQGDLNGTHVIVGEQARVTGAIVAEEIVVRGHVLGSIRGRRVTLQSSSHIEGDIFHQALAIEQGAYFEGKSRRSQDPMAATGETGIPLPPRS